MSKQVSTVVCRTARRAKHADGRQVIVGIIDDQRIVTEATDDRGEVVQQIWTVESFLTMVTMGVKTLEELGIELEPTEE